MNKRILFAAALMLSLGIGAIAQATVSSTGSTTFTTGDATGAVALGNANSPAFSFRVSSNVGVNYAAAADGSTYSVATSHSKGTKTYGSSSADTRIYMADGTNVSGMDAPTAGTTTPPSWTNWTVMQ
jgi:hypothetical protein